MNVFSIVTNNYVNDSRVYKTSNTLLKFGFDVTIIALHKNGLKTKDNIGGICIKRIQLITKSLPKYKVFQFIKYFEFILRCIISINNKSNYIICNDLDTLPIGFLIHHISKNPVKIIYDCHEYETERDGMTKITKIILKYFERILINCTDNIFCVSDSIACAYESDYAIRKPKIVLNCPSFQEHPKKNIFRDFFGLHINQKIFLYQGGLKSGRGIEILIESFSNLQNDNCVIVFMGYGPLENIILAASKKNKTIFLHKAVNPNVLLNYTSSADYGILFYEDTCLNHRYCSPNKIFEYLMAGLPVLTSNLYEMKRLVESEGVGIVADDNTVKGFMLAVENCIKLDYPSTQLNVYNARKKYSWEQQIHVLLSAFTSNN